MQTTPIVSFVHMLCFFLFCILTVISSNNKATWLCLHLAQRAKIQNASRQPWLLLLLSCLEFIYVDISRRLICPSLMCCSSIARIKLRNWAFFTPRNYAVNALLLFFSWVCGHRVTIHQEQNGFGHCAAWTSHEEKVWLLFWSRIRTGFLRTIIPTAEQIKPQLNVVTFWWFLSHLCFSSSSIMAI